jgi:hypothetical protein
MIISGLRISCAITVERAAERGEPLALRRFRLNPRHRFGQRVERRGEELASSSSHGPLCSDTVARQSPVAATSRIACVMADSGRVTVRARA